MVRVVKAGGYGKGGFGSRLETPRISLFMSVYGLSVDVFVFNDLIATPV